MDNDTVIASLPSGRLWTVGDARRELKSLISWAEEVIKREQLKSFPEDRLITGLQRVIQRCEFKIKNEYTHWETMRGE
jgi:hypothetical protein